MRSLLQLRITQRCELLRYTLSPYLFIYFLLRPFLEKLTEISQSTKLHQKLGKQPARMQPLQLIATDTWDISDQLDEFGRISHLLEGSITIAKDVSNEIKYKTRDHLQKIANDFWENKNTANTFLQEVIPLWGKDLSSFKIDTKVSLW